MEVSPVGGVPSPRSDVAAKTTFSQGEGTLPTSVDPVTLENGSTGNPLDSEPRTFEEIAQLHLPRVFQFLCQLTRHRQDAEDLTQQTFIKAFHNLHRYDHRRPVINWLLTIARRTAINHFRDTKKWEVIPDAFASAELSPARLLEQRDQSDSLWGRARRLLSQREFEIMWLRFGEELSTEETARVVGLTQIHVKVLIHRARQRLLKGEPMP